MSYGVMAYLVDTNQLMELLTPKPVKKRGLFSIFSSKKSEQERILDECKSDFDELDEMIEEEDDPDLPASSRLILNEFLTDNIPKSHYGYLYGYVFKILCEHKGLFLDNSEWSPCAIDSFYAIPFNELTLPITFPAPDDWPALGFIDHKKINIEKAEFKDIDEDQKLRLLDWYTQAIETKRDIYLFMH